MQPTLQDPVKFGIMVFPGKIASALPLEQTRVNVHITGLISAVTVVQSFINPYETPIELEYLFPLPENAALIDFSIKIGARVVHGELRELEEAQEAYEQARQEGKQAAKLDQRRPNLFAIQLANVLPTHPILVSISFENRLSTNAEDLEFLFPMGLTPKYHSEIQSDESKGVDSPLAIPGEKIGNVEIEITALLGRKTADPISPSHKLTVERLGEDQFTITLNGQYIPDHDFVLRFPLIEKTLEPVVWCTQDAGSDIALVNWLPVANETLDASLQPREFVFVLDRSGSMSGEPIRQARNALRACLRILDPQDTFRILLFDDRIEWYKTEAIHVAQNEIDQADLYLNTVEGRGGTEIVQAVEEALNLPADSERIRYVLFLTDGAVSAEDRALQSIRKKLKQARIFTFGIGPSVNRALLTKMAQLGRGAAEFLQLDEDIEGTILRFQDKVAFPILTDIRLDWIGCRVWDYIPSMLPDLYAGQSLQLITRLKRDHTGQSSRLHVSGLRGQDKVEMEITLPDSETDMPEVKRAWARARINELLDQSVFGGDLPHKIRQEVIGLAMENKLVTPYTAFVAFDPEVVNPKGEMLIVAIAQPLPEGLNRAGFFPPPPIQMTRASLAMPATPKMMRSKRAADNTSARETAVDHEFYNQSMVPSAEFKVPADIIDFSAGAGRPMIHSDSADTRRSNAEDTLRWLARTQNLNGSWSDEGELTAAALLAFIRQGHTTHRGYYRKQVSRAVEWLLQTSFVGPLAYIRAYALHELASAVPHIKHIQQINSIISRLAPAQTQLEQILHTLIMDPDASITAPKKITDFDSLRFACILKLDLEVPSELVNNDPRNLVRVWSAGLLHES